MIKNMESANASKMEPLLSILCFILGPYKWDMKFKAIKFQILQFSVIFYGTKKVGQRFQQK